MSIFDAITGAELIHVSSGTTTSVTVSQSSASTHRYVAAICNSGGANTQATSAPVIVVWGTAPVPSVTSISPTFGPPLGGTSVTISGTSLTGVTAVKFGLVAATGFSVASDTQITATAPAGANTVDITVTAPGGTSATGSADQFTYATGGATTQYTYDRAGNLIMKQDPGGNCSANPKVGCTTYAYDAANEQTSMTYSDGSTPNVSNVTYDPDGQRTGMTDGTGTSSWSWDSLHRMTSSTNGAGAAVSYAYDLNGNMTKITYPGATGFVTRGYDAAGRLQTVTDWASHTTTFNYDGDSNVTSEVYPNATTASFTPDAADRTMGISDAPTSSPSSPFVSFTYSRDAANQVSGVTSTGVPADTNSYSYTQLNQLKAVNGGSYSYDAADNLTQLVSGAAQSFNPANEITSSGGIALVAKGSGGDSNASTTLSFSAAAAAGDQILVATTQASGTSVSTPSGYSLVGTFSSGTGGVSAIVFRRAASGGESSVTIAGSLPFAKSIVAAVYRGVDPTTPIEAQASAGATANTKVTVPSVTTTVANDRLVLLAGASGNALPASWTPPSGMADETSFSSQSLTSADLSDQTIASPGATGSRTANLSTTAQLEGILLALKPAVTMYSYDLRGNRTTITPPTGSAIALTYDQANRLKTYGSSVTYTYNGDGLRASKTVSGTSTQFTWDVAEDLPLLLVDGTTNYMYGPGGLPLEQITSSGTLYYHQDQLGSTRALSNSAGTVVRTYTYDAYGRLTGSTGTVSNPVGFGGQYTDAETGFIYLRARYYDPSMAQMLTRDPAEALTQEPYDYVANNPLNGTDPTGLWNYHFDYDLGASSMTPEQLMTVVAANFGPLFTVTGHRATLYPGEVMHLHWGPIPGWVRVVHMTATGWTFDTSLHVDWPGFVRFSFSQSDDCHLHLEIHANVNGAGWGLEIPGLHQLYMHKVKELWGQFASNLRKEVLSNE